HRAAAGHPGRRRPRDRAAPAGLPPVAAQHRQRARHLHRRHPPAERAVARLADRAVDSVLIARYTRNRTPPPPDGERVTIPLHVLLVGDDQVATVLRNALRRAGYRPCLTRVTCAPSLASAARRPDLQLVLGAALPELSPAEAVARVRAAAPELPVVAVTSSEDDEAGLAAMAAGARDYVSLDRPARLGAVV